MRPPRRPRGTPPQWIKPLKGTGFGPSNADLFELPLPPQGLKLALIFAALAARSKTGEEGANICAGFPRSENPDLGHPASEFSSP